MPPDAALSTTELPRRTAADEAVVPMTATLPVRSRQSDSWLPLGDPSMPVKGWRHVHQNQPHACWVTLCAARLAVSKVFASFAGIALPSLASAVLPFHFGAVVQTLDRRSSGLAGLSRGLTKSLHLPYSVIGTWSIAVPRSWIPRFNCRRGLHTAWLLLLYPFLPPSDLGHRAGHSLLRHLLTA